MNLPEKILLEELLDLVRALEDTSQEPDLKTRLQNIGTKYQDVSNKKSFWNILDDMCTDIPETYFMLLEYLYAASKDEEVLIKELDILIKGLHEGKIELFYAIFYKWQIIHRNFMTYDSKLLFIERSRLNIELLARMKEFLDYDLDPIPKEERNPDRVLVTITQLLGLKHGPTRNALDYCHTLKTKLGKEVFLLVAAEMPGEGDTEFETYGLDYGYFNYYKGYEGEFSIEYLGEKIQGYQCRINKEKRENIRDIVAAIYQWKPYLVYNIGSENLIVDLCGSFTEEVTVPCGNVYPISEAKYHIVTRRKEERDKDILEYLQSRHHKVIESFFVYKLEEPVRRYRKSDFGIDETAYVITLVGTRLHDEIVEPFISVLKAVLDLDSSVTLVFMGTFDNFEEKRQLIGNPDRVLYVGHQSDLRGALNIADLYLNPIRKGGGTSAAEALAEGVPVISLGNCDVAYTSGEDFLVGSVEEIPALVRRYMTDQEYYQSQKQKAYEQAARVVDTEAVLREILAQIDS